MSLDAELERKMQEAMYWDGRTFFVSADCLNCGGPLFSRDDEIKCKDCEAVYSLAELMPRIKQWRDADAVAIKPAAQMGQ